jgi:multidrug efflux pump subunit AcrB
VVDHLVDTLVAAGVPRVYGIVGDSLNPVTDALRRCGAVRWVDVRHEETAAFAAGAEAQLNMISSYLLSSTVVPILSVWLLKHHGNHQGHQGPQGPQGRVVGVPGVLGVLRRFSLARVQAAFGAAVGWLVARRWVVVPAYLVGCAALLLGLGSRLGTELFPQVDSGEFVLRLTFIATEWHGGKVVPEAARSGAQDRLRPILMTACAMTIGMVPMALALEHGSEMEAPLGRAVIGGLMMSTFVTLFIVPSVFALLMGRSKPRSPSLHPDDPDSARYAPDGREPDAPAPHLHNPSPEVA